MDKVAQLAQGARYAILLVQHPVQYELTCHAYFEAVLVHLYVCLCPGRVEGGGGAAGKGRRGSAPLYITLGQQGQNSPEGRE
jgi:hypothetical protein